MTPARFVPAGVALLALAGIGGVVVAVKPAPTTTAALVTRQVAITGAIRACPPGADGDQNRIALFAASPAGAAAGTATLAPLPQAGVRSQPARQSSVTAQGALALLPVSTTTSVSKQQAWSVTAVGGMAQGAEAEVADGSGLASLSCGEPGSNIWFVGPGQQNGADQIQLDLMNVDSLAAMVNVDVITDAGLTQSSGYTGITVPPHQLVTESLSPVANGASVVAINVRTSAGRVAADVSESQDHGTPSWLPAAAAPATSLIIPGVPPSGNAPGLFLAVPGTGAAKVNIVAVTAQGHYQPLGSQLVDLPGQSASYVPLTALGGSAVALKITANVPVTGAVLVPGSGLGTFTAAAQPVVEQAVIAGNTTSGGLGASIALTAPAGAAQVRLTELAAGAKGGTSSSQVLVTVPAGRTLTTSLFGPSGARRGSPFTVVITPLAGSGPVYADRIESAQGSAVSIIPATSALTTITLPPVRDSYTAISP
jgi:hypothetical protein